MSRFLLPLLLSAISALATPACALSPVLVQLPGDRQAQLLGAWTGSQWLSARKIAPRVGAVTYQALPLTAPSSAVKGGTAAPLGAPGEPCDSAFTVKFESGAASNTFRLLVPSTLKVRPRAVVRLPTTDPTYRAIVSRELKKRGLARAVIHLLGVTRTDLDGDGTQEVLVEAAHFAQRNGLYPPPVGAPGDYSLLLLRHVVNGRVVTTVVGEHLAPRTPWDPGSNTPMPMATQFRLAGVADLNGDGRMEIVTFAAYYEGYALAMHEWKAGSGLRTTLEGGCGV